MQPYTLDAKVLHAYEHTPYPKKGTGAQALDKLFNAAHATQAIIVPPRCKPIR